VEVRITPKRSLWSQIALGLGLTAAIVVSADVSRPFYMTREPIARQIIAHSYVDSAELRAPWMHASAAVAMQTPQFVRDRELFAMDLLRTGKLTLERARKLADVAVREAYTRKVPPALVLGVMLTENDELKSSARSRVGAVGLMQVSPHPWRNLSEKFGSNVRTDSTNLKYGIFILGWVVGKVAHLVDSRDDAWRSALLRYNGCVHGRNTPDCKAYPDDVRRQVETAGKWTCPNGDFDKCVVEPMWRARRSDTVSVATH
jgi:soluble lytic murein transglycosylase-like protein